MVTGYYEPEVNGAREQGGKFQVPVYKRPDDLITLKPDTMRARYNDEITGTIAGVPKTQQRAVPYYTRAEIESGVLAGRGLELLWLDDPVELFFMQIQGSGRVRLPDGSMVRLGYAGKNGHSYTSIGKRLLEMGEGRPERLTMDGIKILAPRRSRTRARADAQEPLLCVLPNVRWRWADRRTGRGAHARPQPRG